MTNVYVYDHKDSLIYMHVHGGIYNYGAESGVMLVRKGPYHAYNVYMLTHTTCALYTYMYMYTVHVHCTCVYKLIHLNVYKFNTCTCTLLELTYTDWHDEEPHKGH